MQEPDHVSDSGPGCSQLQSGDSGMSFQSLVRRTLAAVTVGT